MPIRSCTLPGGGSGYQWGGRGHCYPKRSGAEAQARAAYANGYTEDDGFPAAAGVMIKDSAGSILFMKRAKGGDCAGTWAFPGGMAEHAEDADETARRECWEETGYAPDGELKPISRTFRGGLDFSTFAHDVAERFDPKLNDEHTEHVWAKAEDAPSPLHPGVAALLGKDCGVAMDEAIAFDEASVRTYDKVGRLHVARTPISKANVCPYKGSEIPGAEMLGLEPDRIYYLLRDPEELRKSAATFNGVPLLERHKPTSADDHPKDLTIGATGTSAVYEHPYLYNSLVVWPKGAIKGVESSAKKELSSGYHYDVDMTPGVYEGVRYDGVMRNIRGNHVALVKDGRAGSDVVVGDSKESLMTKSVLTRKGAMLQGALTAYLYPRLAQDARIDLTPSLSGVTAANYPGKRVGIAQAVRSAVKGKLAQDADLDDLGELLEALQGVQPAESTDADPMMSTQPSSAQPMTQTTTLDADPLERIKGFLKGKVSDEDLAKLDGMMGGPTQDEDPDETEEEKAKREAAEGGKDRRGPSPRRRMGRDEPPPFEGRPKLDAEPVSKGAMDQAIAAARQEEREVQAGIRKALQDVAPYVGTLAMDSIDNAEDVYRSALTILQVPHEGVHASALPTILGYQRRMDIVDTARHEPRIGMDSAAAKGFAERFPTATRLA